MEYVVTAPVFVITDHVEPALVDLSILYPVICEPPLLVGALHLRFICVDDAIAVNPVGEDGLRIPRNREQDRCPVITREQAIFRGSCGRFGVRNQSRAPT